MTTKVQCDGVTIGGGKLALSVVNDVCVAHLTGVLTKPLYVELIRRMAIVVEDNDCTAFMLDQSRAASLMVPEDLRAARGNAGPRARSILRIPGAVVCSLPTERQTRQNMWESIQMGYERVAFTDVLAAWAWAERRAREVRLLRLDAESRPGYCPSMPSAL